MKQIWPAARAIGRVFKAPEAVQSIEIVEFIKNLGPLTKRIHLGTDGSDIDAIVPPALLEYRNCTPWRAHPISGAKLFYNPNVKRLAKSNNPDTTGTWDRAKVKMGVLLDHSFGRQPVGGMGVLLGGNQAMDVSRRPRPGHVPHGRRAHPLGHRDRRIVQELCGDLAEWWRSARTGPL